MGRRKYRMEERKRVSYVDQNVEVHEQRVHENKVENARSCLFK